MHLIFVLIKLHKKYQRKDLEVVTGFKFKFENINQTLIFTFTNFIISQVLVLMIQIING